MSQKNKLRYIPLIVAVSIVAGILIGTFYAKRFGNQERPGMGFAAPTSNKLNGLLRIIDDRYVDTVRMSDLIEEAMPQILGELDPHSSYIPAKDLQAVNDDLRGSFSGIGVQFTIQQDTIHISDVISGGPSEKVGIMPGDRIVEIDDSAFVGKIVTNNESGMSRRSSGTPSRTSATTAPTAALTTRPAPCCLPCTSRAPTSPWASMTPSSTAAAPATSTTASAPATRA